MWCLGCCSSEYEPSTESRVIKGLEAIGQRGLQHGITWAVAGFGKQSALTPPAPGLLHGFCIVWGLGTQEPGCSVDSDGSSEGIDRKLTVQEKAARGSMW